MAARKKATPKVYADDKFYKGEVLHAIKPTNEFIYAGEDATLSGPVYASLALAGFLDEGTEVPAPADAEAE